MHEPPDGLRLIRRRDLVEHRLSELSGLLEGLRIAPPGGRVLARLESWLESAEELHETWPIDEWRERIGTWRGDEGGARDRLRLIFGARRHVQAQARHAALEPHVRFDRDVRIEFAGRVFVFTGVFSHCDRDVGEAATAALGAHVHPRVIQGAHYLVVGSWAHPAWKRARVGRKIERVQQWRRAERTECRIVPEDAWAKALRRGASEVVRPAGTHSASRPDAGRRTTRKAAAAPGETRTSSSEKKRGTPHRRPEMDKTKNGTRT